MLKAWECLQQIRRDKASLAELPIAALQALTANINRDPKKAKPFTALDFCMFRERPKEAGLSAEVAAAALSLRHEGKAAPILLAAWPQILTAAKETAPIPAIRALKSDDETVWVLCPVWEGNNVRGGLVAVSACRHGVIRLRDVDRPLITYDLVIPHRQLAGWLEGGLLLVAAEN